MGHIHRRQTFKFQVLILGLFVFFIGLAPSICLSVDLKSSAAESKTSTITPEVLVIVESAAKKQDFSKELNQITELKTKPVSSLIAIFQDANRAWQERWFSAMALSKFPSKETEKVLIQGTKDTLSLIRSVSIQALATFDNSKNNGLFQKALDDSSLLVRDAAVKSLGKIRDREAVELLGKELFNQRNLYRGKPIFGIRENIILALGDIGSMKGVDPLMKVFEQESNPKIQGLACSSLEKIVKPQTDKKSNKCPDFWLAWYKTQNTAAAVSTKK